MSKSSETYQVAIVGGGAVGLFLAICLQKAGIHCLVIEKRSHVREGSRSLGIHPVSLELFQKLNIAKPFVQSGIQIKKGHAFANTHKLGTLSFEDCPPPYNYILALPQEKTESILEQKLNELNPNVLKRNAEVTDITQTEHKVDLGYQVAGQRKKISAKFIIGCDGKNSFVRNNTAITFEGRVYPDTYVMGDFSDNTDFGEDAGIFLCDNGLIESFPLLHNRRRWVVKTEEYISGPERMDIVEPVQKRIGYELQNTEHFMLSSFGVQKFIANPMVQNRIILAGDAAHVVSPIGGQGMNLGWLGTWDLADSLQLILQKDQSYTQVLKQFEQRRFKAARNAIRRAEMNMRLGRKATVPALRNGLVSLMLNTPISTLMAKIFTMRGIERWIT